jgi:hypothetical protein
LSGIRREIYYFTNILLFGAFSGLRLPSFVG